MNKYDYYVEVFGDICAYLDENGIEITPDFDDDATEELYDELWVSDSVTGNASGSYTFNSWEAEENICHNLDLLGEALECFGCGPDYLKTNGAEACDVTIRCYVLRDALERVLEVRREAWYEEHPDGEEE